MRFRRIVSIEKEVLNRSRLVATVLATSCCFFCFFFVARVRLLAIDRVPPVSVFLLLAPISYL